MQEAPYVYSGGKSGKAGEPLATKATVNLEHENRYKGLLWFSTYTVDFSGEYTVQATTASGEFVFELPDRADFFEDIKVTVDGEATEAGHSSGRNSGSQLLINLPDDGQVHQVAVSYTTRGRDSWRYALSRGNNKQMQVKNFSLTATTNFRKINYPGDCISPDPAAKIKGEGLEANWKFNEIWMNQDIGIEMPARQNAGPIAARMSMFAPVSLLFFFTVLFTIVLLKKIPLHPMHYMFISAGFFAFHILLAYLVDVIDVHAAFWICAVVSVFLVVSYMRLVAGVKFAVLSVGLAQLVYLIGFSYAFFYPGKTGLTVVIGAIATLFVLMQTTGKLNWQELFAKPSIPTAHIDKSPEPPSPPA